MAMLTGFHILLLAAVLPLQAGPWGPVTVSKDDSEGRAQAPRESFFEMRVPVVSRIGILHKGDAEPLFHRWHCHRAGLALP